MSGGKAAVRREFRPMLRIALPLVLAEIGWMFMGLVDTVVVGHLPDAAVALSASSLAEVIYNTLAFGVGGVLLGLDTTISQAQGAEDYPAANLWLFQGVTLCAMLSAVAMGMYALMPRGLRHLHTERAILDVAIPTLRALAWGTPTLLLYFTLRRYLQAFNHVRLVAATLISANVVNLFFDWLLVFGHRWSFASGDLRLNVGWDGLGVVGSGVATSLARTYQAVFVVVAILVVNKRNKYGLLEGGLVSKLRPHWASLRRLLALGLPSGLTIFVEILIFAVVTAVIATLGPVPLAGHEIALNIISFTFMVPLGISAAASVRVGQAIGRGSATEAKAAGWAAISLGAGAMLGSAAIFLAIPRLMAHGFTDDRAVIGAAVPLLMVAAVFQFCDGLQVTAIGALRGAGDTISGLLTHLCSYWILGMPLGLYLCFPRKLGATGLWIGLCAALILTGLTMLWRWEWTARTLVGKLRERSAEAAVSGSLLGQ